MVSLRETARKKKKKKIQHFISQPHPAANGILILFGGVNKNPGSGEERTYVNEATSEFFSIETTNETWIGRGDCYVFEMLIKFRSEIRLGSHGNSEIAW